MDYSTYVRGHKYLFESNNMWVYELPVVQNLSLDILWVKSVTQRDQLYGYIFSYINFTCNDYLKSTSNHCTMCCIPVSTLLA